MPQFSTATDAERKVYDMSTMVTMKQYFYYTIKMSSEKPFRLARGIPRVTLLGKKRNWKMIQERLFRYIEGIVWEHFLHLSIRRKPRLLVRSLHHGGERNDPTYLSK